MIETSAPASLYPPCSVLWAVTTLKLHLWLLAYSRYMSNISLANNCASAPPVPARISNTALP